MKRIRLAVVALLSVVLIGVATAPVGASSSSKASPEKITSQLSSYRTHTKRILAFRWARNRQGDFYCWAGIGPYCYDCSGLMYEAYRHVGIYLPRDTFGMLASTKLIRESKSQASKGDLAFFGTGHVEMYFDNNYTYGSDLSGVGYHRSSIWWHPTMFFRVKGARVRV